MIDETELDPRLIAWLRDGPPDASGWVLGAIAEHVRSHPRGHSIHGRWAGTLGRIAIPTDHEGARRRPRPVLVAAALVLAVVGAGLLLANIAGIIVGPATRPPATPASSPAPSIPSGELPTSLVGVWTSGSTRLTLWPCSLGDECGRFERIDDNGEHCVYLLGSRSIDTDAATFASSKGGSFGCAWSVWAGRVLHLTTLTPSTIEFGPLGWPIRLQRVDTPASPAPASPLPEGWSTGTSAARPGIIAALEGRIAAFDQGDFAGAASYWIPDGQLFEYEDEAIYTKGREAIAARLEGVYGVGVRMEAVGAPLQFGRLVAEPVRFVPAPGVDGYGEGILVFEFDDQDRIVWESVSAWLR